MFYGLTKLQVRQLAYKFAIQKSKFLPSNWMKNEEAGEDWLKGFRNRNKDISLQQPEATSLARAAVFNKHNVESFSNNITDVLTRGQQIPPYNIFNFDETGISSVQNSSKTFAAAGTKQVGRITSAERGENVTMCACINAIENALPPAFIFPRVKFNEKRMMRQAPAGSQGFSNPSGWMNNAICFQKFYNTFFAL